LAGRTQWALEHARGEFVVAIGERSAALRTRLVWDGLWGLTRLDGRQSRFPHVPLRWRRRIKFALEACEGLQHARLGPETGTFDRSGLRLPRARYGRN